MVVAAPGTAACTASDPKSPAVQAGLQNGDKIVAVNGVPTSTYQELVTQIRATAGPDNTVTYVRGSNAPVTVNVSLRIRRANRREM